MAEYEFAQDHLLGSNDISKSNKYAEENSDSIIYTRINYEL